MLSVIRAQEFIYTKFICWRVVVLSEGVVFCRPTEGMLSQ